MRDFGRGRDNRGGYQSRGNSRYGRRDDNRGRGGFSGRDRGDRQMHKAVCDNCGKDCEVPFKPTSSKPIYCSDCFEKMGNGGRRDFSGGDRRPQNRGGSNQNKEILESINAKLDKILKLLQAKDEAEETPSENPSSGE